MWFRNVQLYRLPEKWAAGKSEQLSSQLERLLFTPCGSQDISSQGFTIAANESILHSVGGQWLISLGVERRLLPAAVVKQVCADRAKNLEQELGFKPGRKQMKELKESVTAELLPKAFTQRKNIYAWIDPDAGWVAIDAPSRSASEPFIESLFKAIDEFPLKHINTKNSPSSVMTEALASHEAPFGFTVDQDAELHAAANESSAVRYMQHSLDGEEIREHIAAGKKVSKLALTFDDRISFTLTDKFEIKRIKPLDAITGQHDGNAKTREEQFDADFMLMTGELQKLFPALLDALGGEVKTV